jgi:glycosyltransferase involved in cell wall biosynthesis
MRPIRLLYILDNYWPHVGGAERAFKGLCEGLAARGHTVTVLTQRSDDSPAEELHEGVRIVRVAAPNRYAFSFAALLPALKLARDADLIHAATFNAAPIGSLAGFFSRKPTILTIFETWIGRWGDYSDFSPWKARAHDLAERAILAFRFTHYVGISEATSRRVREVVRHARGRDSTIYFDFDPAPWQRGDPQAARTAVAADGAFLIVGFGRPGTSKGFGYLIDAFPEIRRKLPSAKLALVLSESQQYAAALKALKSRASEGIVFLASLPFEDLVSLVRAADCVVVPSVTEGFGYTTLEATAAGVPVVACDTTSIPEVIGGRHLLVPPRDSVAIARAVLDVSRGIVNETPTRTFSLMKTLDRFEALYEKLLS